MATDPKAVTGLMLHRFGFGARPGDLDAIGRAPGDALRAEIDTRAVARPRHPDLPSSHEALAELDEFRTERQRRRDTAMRAEQAIDAAGAGMLANPPPPARELNVPAIPQRKTAQPPAMPPFPQRVYRAEALARFAAAVETRIGLAERMVWFW
ncbi:MAG: DUF1800 family protein, partial [Beijerinckiaceae bacterium]